MPFLDDLRAKCGEEWPAIANAKRQTDEMLQRLASLRDFAAPNTAVVVLGSLGRDEITSGSDVDWYLLIDGPADPNHYRIAQDVEGRLSGLGLPQPGRTGIFGAMVSSHELIHHIGGIHDTNQNLTRRILLLLESRALTENVIHERVLRGILGRYVADQIVPSPMPQKTIPHFLLNDTVRYWRTITVDYAAKIWEQAEAKWAIRNAKLRISRKMLFAAGLLLCLHLELFGGTSRDEIRQDAQLFTARFTDYLFSLSRRTPLEIVAEVLLRCASEDAARMIIGTYDRFLALLNDDQQRRHLEDLQFDEAANDPVWSQIRDMSHQFRDGLLRLFYDENEGLRELVRKYGVF